MTDLGTQIRAYIDEIDEPLSAVDLMRDQPAGLQPRRRSWDRPLAVVACGALVVLMLIGGPLFLLGTASDDQRPSGGAVDRTTVSGAATTTAPETDRARIVTDVQGPLVWRWQSSFDTSDEPLGLRPSVVGPGCYGSGFGWVTMSDSKLVEFRETTFRFTLGTGSTPGIAVVDDTGLVTPAGNPFGEDAWLCSVAASDSTLIAVGSSVFMSTDGASWTSLEAFDSHAGRIDRGSRLVWVAAGRGGYMVLGTPGTTGWYSIDLVSWYEIPLGGHWGWLGPPQLGAEGDLIIVMEAGGAWIGTPVLDRGLEGR